MASPIRPRLSGIVEGLVVTVIVTIASAFAAGYQEILRADAKAKVHLGPVGATIAALSPWAVVALTAALTFIVALAALLFFHWYTRDKNAPIARESRPDVSDPAAESDLKYVLKTTRADLDVARTARETAERKTEALERVTSALKQQRDQATVTLDRVRNAHESQSVLNQNLDEQLRECRNERDAALREVASLKSSRGLLTEIETWLDLRSEKHPENTPDKGPVINILQSGRFDAETAGIYQSEYAERAKAAFVEALSYNRVRDADIDALIIDGPKGGSDIRKIVRYIRYLQTGSAERL